MEKIVYNLVYNRKKRLNRKGTALVQIEAYLARKKKYFSTKVYLTPAQWDARRQRVKRHPNADGLNRWLCELMERLERCELSLRRLGRPVTLDLLKLTWHGSTEKQSFLCFFRSEVSLASLRNSTKRNLLSTLSLLEHFRPDIAFGEVTFELIADFDCYLRRRGLHPNTVAKHMRHLKRQVNRAIDLELLDEVVVVGYGTGKKLGSVVGSVSTVNNEKLEAKPSMNFGDALQGQVAGLLYIRHSSQLAEAGKPFRQGHYSERV